MFIRSIFAAFALGTCTILSKNSHFAYVLFHILLSYCCQFCGQCSLSSPFCLNFLELDAISLTYILLIFILFSVLFHTLSLYLFHFTQSSWTAATTTNYLASLSRSRFIRPLFFREPRKTINLQIKVHRKQFKRCTLHTVTRTILRKQFCVRTFSDFNVSSFFSVLFLSLSLSRSILKHVFILLLLLPTNFNLHDVWVLCLYILA